MLSTLRSAIFTFLILLLTVLYGVLSIFLYLVPRKIAHRIIVSWCVVQIFLGKLICGVRYEVEGLEHIDLAAGPFVILSKHQSAWETFFLQSLFYPCATILKKELLQLPFFGWGLRLLQPIPIDRSNPKVALKQVKQGGVARLQKGLNVLLFPEGTRVAYGTKGKYARSGADTAIAAGVNVLPVALNSGKCWPAKSWIKTPGTITVVVGSPISTEGKNSKALIQEVETWIEAQQARIEKQ